MLKLSVRTALSGMFAGLILAIGGVGWLGLSELKSVNHNVEEIGNDWLPSVNLTRKLQVDQSTLRIREARHLLASDPQEMANIELQISEAHSDIKEGLKAYKALLSDPAEQENFLEIERGFADYEELSKEALALSRALKTAEATLFFNDKLNPKAIEIRSFIDNAVDMNTKGAAQEVARASASYSSAFNFLVAGIVVALGLGCAGIAFAVMRVIRPIGSMTNAMGMLAKGDMSVNIPGVGRADEIGDMASAAQVFKDNMIEAERMRQEQAALEQRAAAQRKADMNMLADQFQQAVGGIIDTVSSTSSQLETAATSLTKTADSTQSQSGVVASASEQTSANVQGVAAAAEQLAATVGEIARQVQQSSTISQRAVEQATKTNGRVVELSESATRIGDVVELINSIAGQTNLLALNATIEAARAGEAGKGFAVVAQEVKALAAQTAKATSEIGHQITGMQNATAEAVVAIREIGDTINQMSEISGAIASAVEEQGATTQEISRNVTEAAKGTAEVACNITEVNRGAAETGSASTQVLSSAKQLAEESHILRREVETFLATVRAA